MSSSDGGDVRAEILDLGDQRLLAAEIIIDAPANVIFDILVQPQRHIDVDGQRSGRNGHDWELVIRGREVKSDYGRMKNRGQVSRLM